MICDLSDQCKSSSSSRPVSSSEVSVSSVPALNVTTDVSVSNRSKLYDQQEPSKESLNTNKPKIERKKPESRMESAGLLYSKPEQRYFCMETLIVS